MLFKELKNKSVDDLNTYLKDLLQSHLKLRIDDSINGVADNSQFKKARKNIARVRTILRQRMM